MLSAFSRVSDRIRASGNEEKPRQQVHIDFGNRTDEALVKAGGKQRRAEAKSENSMANIDWEEAAEFIRSKGSFLLTTHVNPEGDAIGSERAMALLLRGLGKWVGIVNSSPTPKNCVFLDAGGEIMVYPHSYDPAVMERAEGVIILDVNGWVHLGAFSEELRKSPKPRLCIDHHEGFENEFVDVLVNDTTAASAGVLVYELTKHMGGAITPEMATALYASLITDTGTFRFSNTDPRAFRIAAELCEVGADPFSIHRQVFANRSWGAARLLGPVLGTLKSTPDKRLAWIYVTSEMFAEADAEYEDSDGLLELVRSIKGVELCLFFKEAGEGLVKVSLRSNGNIDAYRIARRFGGGGHRMAAGMNVEVPLARAIPMVVGFCRKQIEAQPPGL